MAVNPSFRAFVLEQLGRTRSGIRARNMFGGTAIYAGDVCFALIAEDTLYFRVGDENRPQFEARGMEAFRPFGEEYAHMPYYELPEDLLEDPDALRPWAEAAIEVARLRKAASARKRKSPAEGAKKSVATKAADGRRKNASTKGGGRGRKSTSKKATARPSRGKKTRPARRTKR